MIQPGETLISKRRKSYTFTMQIKNPKRSLFNRVFKKPIIRERTFKIESLVAGTVQRVATRLLLLPKEIIQGTLSEAMLPILEEHLFEIIYIICTGIQNNCLEPRKELLLFMEQNLEQSQILEAFAETIEALCLEDFLRCLLVFNPNLKTIAPEKATDADPSTLKIELLQTQNDEL